MRSRFNPIHVAETRNDSNWMWSHRIVEGIIVASVIVSAIRWAIQNRV